MTSAKFLGFWTPSPFVTHSRNLDCQVLGNPPPPSVRISYKYPPLLCLSPYVALALPSAYDRLYTDVIRSRYALILSDQSRSGLGACSTPQNDANKCMQVQVAIDRPAGRHPGGRGNMQSGGGNRSVILGGGGGPGTQFNTLIESSQKGLKNLN